MALDGGRAQVGTFPLMANNAQQIASVAAAPNGESSSN